VYGKGEKEDGTVRERGERKKKEIRDKIKNL
jgi:hypothetical protein